MTEQRFYEEQEAKIQVTVNRMIEKYQQQRLLFNPHFKRKLRDEMEGLDYAKLNEIMAGSFKKEPPRDPKKKSWESPYGPPSRR